MGTGLPTSAANGAAADLQKSVRSEIASDGGCVFNGVANSREQLNRLQRRYSRLMPDAEFLIGCDPEAKHHVLVTLLADLAGHRLKNVKLLKSSDLAGWLWSYRVWLVQMRFNVIFLVVLLEINVKAVSTLLNIDCSLFFTLLL